MQILQMKENTVEQLSPKQFDKNSSEITWEDVQGLSWIFQDD